MGHYREFLNREFQADEGSFLIKLRVELEWDRDAFSRLTIAMQECCAALENDEAVDRVLACGFWYLAQFVKDWTTHPNFPKDYSQDYYSKSYERLDDLAYWFFMGQSPYQPGQGFEPL